MMRKGEKRDKVAKEGEEEKEAKKREKETE